MSDLEVTPLALPEVLLIKPKVFRDQRGFFTESYSKQKLAVAGIDLDFVQDNHSLSAAVGTLRGLHYQLPPRAQDKLLRVVQGRVYDVAVDIRRSSPRFGQWVGMELSAENGLQILVPAGFAHGFVTLDPDTEVIYKVTEIYSPAHDAGIRFDDPALAIDWPLAGISPVLSDKDQKLPPLSEAAVFA